MKYGTNHITQTGRITEYSWRYYERKVGVYLDLRTPLVAAPTGRTGWTTRIEWRPYRICRIARFTYLLEPGSLRRTRVSGPKRYWLEEQLDLSVKFTYPFGQWIPKSVIIIHKPISITHVLESANFNRGVIDTGVILDLVEYHNRVAAFIRGCAAEGQFRPIVDWLVENSPDCIARMFTEAGELKEGDWNT